jgi:hypothetical protein
MVKRKEDAEVTERGTWSRRRTGKGKEKGKTHLVLTPVLTRQRRPRCGFRQRLVKRSVRDGLVDKFARGGRRRRHGES